VSRVHARVVAADGRATIEDAGGKNGTWVNGTRREGPADLLPDDEVSLGSFRMVFHAGGTGSSTRTGRPE
jgi:pSer/pThr/pTyr-binding forkhead associated (FHA) protein